MHDTMPEVLLLPLLANYLALVTFEGIPLLPRTSNDMIRENLFLLKNLSPSYNNCRCEECLMGNITFLLSRYSL